MNLGQPRLELGSLLTSEHAHGLVELLAQSHGAGRRVARRRDAVLARLLPRRFTLLRLQHRLLFGLRVILPHLLLLGCLALGLSFLTGFLLYLYP